MSSMGPVEWGALVSFIMLQIAIIGVVVRLVDRLNKAEAGSAAAQESAHAASISAAGSHVEIDRLKAELVDHRVAVAKEYVSKDTLAPFETRIMEAINRLDHRLDTLFKGAH